jgi:hypothetical protein
MHFITIFKQPALIPWITTGVIWLITFGVVWGGLRQHRPRAFETSIYENRVRTTEKIVLNAGSGILVLFVFEHHPNNRLENV